MTSPNVPRNAYTDAPEQHPNLIIGSLQLLCWMIFRPSAFRNHLTPIDDDLMYGRAPIILFVRGSWLNLIFWRLVIEGKLILLLLANLLLALVLWGLGVPAKTVTFGVAWSVALGASSGVALGMALGASSIVVLGMGWGVGWLVALSIASGIVLRVGWLVSGVAVSIVSGVMVSVVSGVAVSVVSGVVSGVAVGLGWTVGMTIYSWLPVLLDPFITVWNTLLYRLDKQRTDSKLSLLHWHSAFWDEWQRLPLQGLDKHVLLVMERNPDEGKVALNYLSTSRQRWAAQAVQIELDARELENCTDVAAISEAHSSLAVGELNSPVSALLSSFSHISQDVDAALNQGSTYNQRLVLSAVAERLNGLIRELTRSSDKYSVRFRPIATQWYEIVSNHIQELVKTVELRQEIDNPYIIGVPLTEQQQIFTGRTDIGTRIEQLILDRRRPPLLLYGQRRMGKTSLLNNLGRLLPNNIIPMFVDLQGPVSSASDYTGFLYNIAKAMIDSAQRQSAVTLPPLTRETLAVDPFTSFDEWLDEVEQTLDQNIALLSLDEFEALDDAISKGRFDEQDVLGMLRHLIQHRPRFKLLLAGSHTIEEFQRWASYLINVQVLHISYLKEPEARQLIERPVKDFTLRYEPDAVERVLQLTRCHPYLVQLLCAEIIYLKNEQDRSVRRLAKLADVEAAVPAALSSGSLYFADIQNNQVGAGLAVLRFIAAQGEGATVSREVLSREFATSPPTPLLAGEGSNLPPFPAREGGLGGLGQSYFDTTLELLLRRELIEEIGEGYRFQVELIRCWFVGK